MEYQILACCFQVVTDRHGTVVKVYDVPALFRCLQGADPREVDRLAEEAVRQPVIAAGKAVAA